MNENRLPLCHAILSSFTDRGEEQQLPDQAKPAASQESPLVSILIVVFQARAELQTLLENLLSCDLSQTEVIVIDGGSTDGTLDLLQSCTAVTRWISEPDHGVYDAMNKAVRAARGTYLLHLNAGDGLLYVPLPALRECLRDGIDVASFCVLVNGTRNFCPRTGIRTHIENTWHHQGTFYRREAHLLYDPKHRVYGDFDLNQRMRTAGCSVRLFSETIATHSTGGVSSALSLTSANRAELWKIIRTYSGVGYFLIAFAKFHLYLLRERMRAHTQAA